MLGYELGESIDGRERRARGLRVRNVDSVVGLERDRQLERVDRVEAEPLDEQGLRLVDIGGRDVLQVAALMMISFNCVFRSLMFRTPLRRASRDAPD
jgi:hypothetical protein